MKKMRWAVGLLTLALAATPCFAASLKTKMNSKKSVQDQVLSEGRYTAKVRALVCGGCGPLIETTMTQVKGIEKVSVNQETSVLVFSVQKGAQVKRADLEKILTDSANSMGMGANFDLLDLKPIKMASSPKPQ